MLKIILGLAAAVMAGVGIGYAVRALLGKINAEAREKKAEDLLEQANREAETIKRECQLQAKAEVIKAREEFEKSVSARKKEVAALEERISQRELNLERKVALIEKKEKAIEEKLQENEKKEAEVEALRIDLGKLTEEAKEKLQKVAGLSREEARKTMLSQMEKEMQSEVGMLIKRMQDDAKASADREARKIVAQAIQRCASSHASEMMTSTVVLPNDEMKGRIIGRDGRNIRALEGITGVDILIDDTPEAVVISGFDPIRREVAKQSLEKLIEDGRIHPSRIEEIVAKTQEDIEDTTRLTGEEACCETNVQGVGPELLRMIGRLNFRTSYTQNVLRHSIEVANLMGVMAGELGLDVSLARRIGLFHDIGKAMDHEIGGNHAIIGADFLKRHSESAMVVNAVAAHHEEVPAESPYAVLASAADAISSSRLGARQETTEIYINRLEKLEAIANGFEGVEKSYAIHAGREVRVFVQPDKIDDNNAMVLARNISKKIEEALQYPGQIKVVVVRETRCVEFAR